MTATHTNGTYRPYFVADRPNHINILAEAAEETGQFGVVVRATVTETVQDLVADLPVPVFVDCGAFAEDGAIQSLHDLFERYEQMNADYGLIPDVLNERVSTLDSAAHASRLYERGRWSFELVGVAQGTAPHEYAAAVWDLYQLGFDKIALGGLLDVAGDRSGGHAHARDAMLQTVRSVCDQHPRKWLFVLGGHSADRRPVFEDLNIAGADSKGWLYRYDGSLPASRHDQLVNEVLDTTRTSMPSLTSYSEVAPDGGCVKSSTETGQGGEQA